MRKRIGPAVIVGLLVLGAGSTAAQRRAPKVDGAWQRVGGVVVAPDSTYPVRPWSGMLVFSGKFFSQLWVVPEQEGARQQAYPTTVEEKVARFDAIIANAGIFTIHDSTATMTFQQAKNPSLVGRAANLGLRTSGDSLWLTSTAPWSKDSSRSVRTTVVYTRLR